MDKHEQRKILGNVSPEMQYAFLLQMAQKDLMVFARHVLPEIIIRSRFHDAYYRIVNEFAKGNIRKLIIQAPPQHGKSLCSSTLLPAYMLGLNPDLAITIGSYSATLASDFNRNVLPLEKYRFEVKRETWTVEMEKVKGEG